MKAIDFIREHGHDNIRFAPDKYKDGRYGLTVNGYHPIPIENIRKELYSNDLIVIKDDSGLLGYLLLLTGDVIYPTSVSDIIYAAYIRDLNEENYGEPYTLKNNYMIVQPGRLVKYHHKYKDNALVWGGFSHVGSVMPQTAKKRDANEIMVSGFSSPKHTYQYELLAIAEQQPFSFERYLRYYHCLEYIFEWQIVEKIKNTNNNLDGYTDTLRDLANRTEIERLKATMKAFIGTSDAADIGQIFIILKDPTYFQIAKNILFDYGKDSNPMKDGFVKFQDIIMNYTFEPQHLRACGVSNHDQIFFSFICYTIYRLRCCIAHTKLSEYVLKPSDEPFIADFGEPLIRFCLKKYFST